MSDTPKPMEGTWTLTAPDGRAWTAESPLRAVSMEQRERVPADVAIKRIFDAADVAQPPQAAVPVAWIDRHPHPWSKDLGFVSDLRWAKAEVEGEGVPLYASPPPSPDDAALMRQVAQFLQTLECDKSYLALKERTREAAADLRARLAKGAKE